MGEIKEERRRSRRSNCWLMVFVICSGHGLAISDPVHHKHHNRIHHKVYYSSSTSVIIAMPSLTPDICAQWQICPDTDNKREMNGSGKFRRFNFKKDQKVQNRNLICES